MSKEIEIVLVQDVKGLGKFGQTRKVKLGYARNYLLPYQFAILSTPANLHRFKSIEKRELKRVAEERVIAEALASQLNGKKIVIGATAQENGALYGSVSAADIAHELKNAHGIEIDRHSVSISENFKELGEFEISIDLPQGIVAQIGLTISPEVKETKTSKKTAKA
jgi:large subunit ribosomal protein L9